MKDIEIKRFLPGLILVLLGVEVIFSLKSVPRLGGIGFLITGSYLIFTSEDGLKEKVKEPLPFRPRNLLRYPRLPYFQTSVLILVLLASVVMIYNYMALVGALIGLAASQFILSSLKKNIQERSKIILVMEFQLFIFFSTFIYAHFHDLLLLEKAPGFSPSLILMIAWIGEIMHLYINIFK